MESNPEDQLRIDVLQLQREKLQEELKVLRKGPRWWARNWGTLLTVVLAIAGLYTQHAVTQIRIDRMQREATQQIQEADERSKVADIRTANAQASVAEAQDLVTKARLEQEAIEVDSEAALTRNALEQRRLQQSVQNLREVESKLAKVSMQLNAASPRPPVLTHPVVNVGGSIQNITPGGVNNIP